MAVHHNKLVRDRIPAEIEARGGSCTFRKLSEAERIMRLLDKLVEEANEVKGATTEDEVLAELGDVADVAYHILVAIGKTSLQLNASICEKQRRQGRFAEGIFLLTSTEPQS